jgi:phage/plasmid-like protein (TIGR03299 family)
MAHMVETAFYAKEPAWHGLGTVVSETQTSIDALRLAGLDWDVQKRDLFYDSNGLKKIEDRVANVRLSDGKLLGIVSDHYKILQNREAFSFIDELLDNQIEPVKFEAAGSLDNGKRVWMLAHMKPKMILGDEIIPYLVFTNSHDGSQAITAALTPTRVVCQNTLNLALKEAKRSWSIKHMGDVKGKQKDAAMTLKLSVSYMDNMEIMAEQYQQKKVTKERMIEIMNIIFPDDPEATMRARGNILDQKQQFLDVYAQGLVSDLKKFKGDAWGLYNGFADYASHIKPLRKTDSFQESLFSSFIDGNKLLAKAQKAIEEVCA